MINNKCKKGAVLQGSGVPTAQPLTSPRSSSILGTDATSPTRPSVLSSTVRLSASETTGQSIISRASSAPPERTTPQNGTSSSAHRSRRSSLCPEERKASWERVQPPCRRNTRVSLGRKCDLKMQRVNEKSYSTATNRRPRQPPT